MTGGVIKKQINTQPQLLCPSNRTLRSSRLASRNLIVFGLVLFTSSVFSSAETFKPLTESEIAATYRELKADFESNEIFKNANINLYRDGVRSPWSGYYDRESKEFVTTNNAWKISDYSIRRLREYSMIDYRPFLLAMQGRNRILSARAAAPRTSALKNAREDLLVVVDFTLSSYYRRLYVFDLKSMKVVLNTWTSHASKSDPEGNNYPTDFSNVSGTDKSSPGFFITGVQYDGKWGNSLRLHGIDGNLNSAVFDRGVVIHGWGMGPNGPTATSQGCLMISYNESTRFYGLPGDQPLVDYVIDELKGGAILYTHTDVYEMEKTSKWLKPGDAVTASIVE